MKNQLKMLTAAVLMTVALSTTQAFAAVDTNTHSTVAAATATQSIQVADWDFDPTNPDTGC